MGGGRKIGLATTAVGMLTVTTAGSLAGQDLDRVGWLAGCWRSAGSAVIVDEQWMAASGGVMLGMSRTVRGDAVVAWEHLRIEREGEQVRYVADPSGQAETVFVMRPGTGSDAVFENPAHDFPQRVRYRPVGSDSLVASIEGTSNGVERVVRFPFGRVACPG